MNKLILGDCYDKLREVSDNSVDLIIADPPYVVTKEKWDQKDIITEQLSKEFHRVLKDTGSFYCWCGIGGLSGSLFKWYPIFKKDFIFQDLVTWKKQRGRGMRRGWLYTREEILWFTKDKKNYIWNKKEQLSEEKYDPAWIKRLGREYKRLTNVWTDIKEETLSGNTGIKDLKKKMIQHYTPKPLKALERIIKVHTKENDVILDPFFGSGTTGVACKKLNRNFIGIEINPIYFELGKKRIEETEKNLFSWCINGYLNFAADDSN